MSVGIGVDGRGDVREEDGEMGVIWRKTWGVMLAAVSGVLLALCFFFAKGQVGRHQGERERAFLKRYLHETNEDKDFQKLKQSQWFPNCQCFSPQS